MQHQWMKSAKKNEQMTFLIKTKGYKKNGKVKKDKYSGQEYFFTKVKVPLIIVWWQVVIVHMIPVYQVLRTCYCANAVAWMKN
tara:strand:+ start:62080 stop:62328 length:249 start_codon:yes stop_codon:yes gene_type:complete